MMLSSWVFSIEAVNFWRSRSSGSVYLLVSLYVLWRHNVYYDLPSSLLFTPTIASTVQRLDSNLIQPCLLWTYVLWHHNRSSAEWRQNVRIRGIYFIIIRIALIDVFHYWLMRLTAGVQWRSAVRVVILQNLPPPTIKWDNNASTLRDEKDFFYDNIIETGSSL